jgi:hypothetical protein
MYIHKVNQSAFNYHFRCVNLVFLLHNTNKNFCKITRKSLLHIYTLKNLEIEKDEGR